MSLAMNSIFINYRSADSAYAVARIYQCLTDAFGREMWDHGYPWGSAREDLASTRHLIETHGYHRRDRELTDAEEAARNWPAPPPPSDSASG